MAELEAGGRRVMGLDLDTERDLRNRNHPPRQSHSRLHHHHRRLRLRLLLLRGAAHPRPGAQPRERRRSLRSATPRRCRLHRNSIARPDGEFLPRSLAAALEFRRFVARSCGDSGNPPRALHHLASQRFHARHRRSDRRNPRALRPLPSSGAVRIDAHPARHAPHLHARGISRKDFLDSRRAPPDQRHQRHHRRLPRRNAKRISKRHSRCSTRSATTACSPSNIRRGRTPPRAPCPMPFPRKRRAAASPFCRIASARFRPRATKN